MLRVHVAVYPRFARFVQGRLRESQYLGLAEDEERRARKAQAVWGWPKDLGGRWNGRVLA